MATFTPPPVLTANKTRLERVVFTPCYPPEPIWDVDADGNTVVDADGNPVQATDANGNPKFIFAYMEAQFIDHMDGAPVRRETMGNEILDYEQDTLPLAGILSRKMQERAEGTGLEVG